MAISPPKVEHINPFLQATCNSFETMIGMKAKPGKPSLKQGMGVSYDVSGVIGLSGEAKGSVVISFPKETALKVVSAFIGETVPDLNEDITDAVGELANIIAGSAKKNLVDFKINISLPTVVMGSEHSIFEPKDVLSMIIPFECDAGHFDVAVNLKSV